MNMTSFSPTMKKAGKGIYTILGESSSPVQWIDTAHIEWYQWGFWWLFISDSIKYKLTNKVSYSCLHRYQCHIVTPSTTQNNSQQTVNDIHDLHNASDPGICRRNGQGRAGQRFSAFSLPISWTSDPHFHSCTPLLKVAGM